MSLIPETKEEYSAHIPAIQVLSAMGWDYLSPADCLGFRGSNQEVILTNVLVDELRKRKFEYKGKTYPLSTNAIDQIVRELSSPSLHEGLLTANEKLYNKLTLGVTVTEFIEGKKYSPTVSIIDWKDLTANSFIVTEELEVLSSGGTHTRRPDVVCYVNGLPLVVIEAKRPDSGNPNKSMIDEGISQNIRNQKNDEVPKLFSYSQLLMSVSSTDGRYATTKTPKKFWAKWREEEFDETCFADIKNKPVSNKLKDALFAHRPAKVRKYFEGLWSGKQLPTDQDRLLVSLLDKKRLLEFIRFFILYDRKFGKIAARYQQAFGIKALVERINKRKSGGGREGGVIWHTTGSGKSFTMVYLCKALLLHESLKECRVVVVTDRVDLEKQLANTFLAGGAFGSEIASKKEGERAKVGSGRDLAKRIGRGNERIIFTIIDKFHTASKQPECHNPSENMIVLVDEGHRSHGGEGHERMRKALPNASYIAFTGTPILKDDKTTNKFGPIVHAYTMQRAVEDGTVTPLLYEERIPELEINEKAIDNWFDKITAGLSDEQKSDLKKKWGKKGPMYSSANRIELIAWDIAVHFSENIKTLGQGLKGQLATDSKRSAIRYKKALDETGLVSSAVIISPPDTREGHSDVDESELPEIQQWWKDNVGNDAEDYERGVIEHFGTGGPPDILIVVDKLLTGFDEPRNAVLYIDKQLKQHNLIQAIARVNRLHEAKQYGLLIDYRGILKELDTAIDQYQDLANRTQGGFDIDDIEGLYHQVSTEYKRLPGHHDRLWAIFACVENKQDLEQYRQLLVPHYQEDEEGQSYDTHQSIREDFYQALTEYGMCLKVALSSRSFFEDASFTEKQIQTYKNDLRFFTNLRKITKQDAQETVDYSAYEDQIRRLVDKHVVGAQIKESEGVIMVNELGKDQDPDKWSEEKTRNETDIIRSRIKKTIEQDLADDPYAQIVFSELLKQAIAEAEAMFDHPHKQYMLFKEFEEKVKSRDVDTVPDTFGDNQHAKAYYGTFRLVLGSDYFEKIESEENQKLIDEALYIDEKVRRAVAEHSLNPQNIESEIRKQLLPRMFKLMGLDHAKEVIERVIQITRVGISKGAA
ncbi:MAG: HsdR family type I site-specific deoxyribonuclease [Candidatus Thiodiazotropha sp. (ex Troendleina suluensis)]|nr:HsdR family type I site-specific deoxyribonuclease [Candidatus Thiodiazotropha sp. (ex Troendleina suluensis)]